MLADAIHRCPPVSQVMLEGRREEDGTVVIETVETAPGLGRPVTEAEVEAGSLTMPFLRRLVAAEAASLEIEADPARGRVRVAARFPDPVAAAIPRLTSGTG